MKRSLRFALALGLLFIVGIALRHVVAAPGQMPKNVQWEYRIAVTPIEVLVAVNAAAKQDPTNPFGAIQKAKAQKLEEIFNQLGDEGWELASYSDLMSIFKRPKQ